MKTVRIAESGALERLGKFYHNRQAALVDRLQQVLDSLNPQEVAVMIAAGGTPAGNDPIRIFPPLPRRE